MRSLILSQCRELRIGCDMRRLSSYVKTNDQTTSRSVQPFCQDARTLPNVYTTTNCATKIRLRGSVTMSFVKSAVTLLNRQIFQ